jgi:predicted nucleotidyltransferase
MRILNSKVIAKPIEGFFVKSVDNLLFDVKGLSHPQDKIISFVRYVPIKYLKANQKSNSSEYFKIYDLKTRYDFLRQNFPKYLYEDHMGRGLLQAVAKVDLLEIYNPIQRMQQITGTEEENLDSLEKLVREFSNKLLKNCNINSRNLGVTGSILVNLHSRKSDIDLVVYGRKDGLEVFQGMSSIFEKYDNISRYSESELKKLWKNRGQQEQIDFESFLEIEKNKQLQGTINNVDFYIRLVLLPDEYHEPYDKTKITSLGECEIEATVENDEYSIFTPSIYHLINIQLKNDNIKEATIPDRIFSVRGRYCDLAKTGERISANGKLERVKIENQQEYYQLTLGTSKREYMKKI